MANIGQSGFGEFDRLLAVVRRTRELLDASVGTGGLPEGGADYLADATLPHVEGIQDGFRTWLRADMAGLDELRHLVLQAGPFRAEPARNAAERAAAEAEAGAERLARRDPGIVNLREPRPWGLAALAHARLVLAWLPRIPDADVRYPTGRRTYADIPTPRGPAELAGRLEELECQLWRTATHHASQPADPAFRRAYGFFDAADRLGEDAFRLPG